MLLIGLFYILIPTILIAVLAAKRQATKLSWILSSLLTGMAVIYILTIARWEVVSIYLRYLFPILYLIACFLSYKRIKIATKEESKIAATISISLNVLLIIFFSVMSFLALRGYRILASYPDRPVAQQAGSMIRPSSFLPQNLKPSNLQNLKPPLIGTNIGST